MNHSLWLKKEPAAMKTRPAAMKKRPAAMKKAAMKKRPAARKKRPAAVKKRPAHKFKIYVAAAPSDTIKFADQLETRVDQLETRADRSWKQGEEVLEALRLLKQQIRLLPYQKPQQKDKPDTQSRSLSRSISAP